MTHPVETPSSGDGHDEPPDGTWATGGRDAEGQRGGEMTSNEDQGEDADPRAPDPVSVPAEHSEPDEAQAQAPGPERASSGGGFWAFARETAIVLVTALVLSLLIKTFLVQAFFIPSQSMENTLLIGDRVLVSKLSPGPFDLHRGDIVVFKDPGGWLPPEPEVDNGPLKTGARDLFTFIGLLPSDSGEHLIKRVIGVGGDTVECCDAQGRLMINGQPIDESSYLHPGAEPSAEAFKVTVPEGRLWVMGDNRNNSRDSRANRGEGKDGTIPVDNVVGRAFVLVWPADRFRWLTNPSSVFEDVPEP